MPSRCLSVGLVAWAVVSRRFYVGVRRASMIATILLVCGVFVLLRTDGIKGAGSEFAWRWTKTPRGAALRKGAVAPARSGLLRAATKVPKNGSARGQAT